MWLLEIFGGVPWGGSRAQPGEGRNEGSQLPDRKTLTGQEQSFINKTPYKKTATKAVRLWELVQT